MARDLRLPGDWLNTVVRHYAALSVGIADRCDLIFLKLYAAADQTGPESVHFQDLLALRPSDQEFEDAAVWVREQDPSAGLAAALSAVVEPARRSRH